MPVFDHGGLVIVHFRDFFRGLRFLYLEAVGRDKMNVLTKEKKFAWQSSRLAPLVWVLAPVMLKTCP